MTKRRVVAIAVSAAGSFLIHGMVLVINRLISPTGTVLMGWLFVWRVITLFAVGFSVLTIIAIFSRGHRSGEDPPWKAIFTTVIVVSGWAGLMAAAPLETTVTQRGYVRFVDAHSPLVAELSADPTIDLGSTRLKAARTNTFGGPAFSYGDTILGRAAADRLVYATRVGVNGHWQLSITLGLGPMSWITFLYRSDGDYPPGFEPLGDWAVEERIEVRYPHW